MIRKVPFTECEERWHEIGSLIVPWALVGLLALSLALSFFGRG